MTKRQAKLIGYVRVSRVGGREGDSFISPAVQRERIEAYAQAGGHTVVEVLTELDQPGSKYERPLFQQALEAVEAGEADGIIVARLDRFARSVTDAGLALRRLEAAGGVLVAIDLGMDTSTSGGRLMRNVLMSLAEFELDRIRENWHTARVRAIDRGVHISNVPPLGYLRGDDGKLIPDPETAPVVHQLFLSRAAGASWRECCKLLDEHLPRPDGGRWPLSTVNSIVSRRTYLGEAHAGDVVQSGAHPALVNRAEWEAAQAPPLGRSPRRDDGGALLTGLIVCESCGQPMTREGSGRRGPWMNYACRKRHSGGVCKQPVKISTSRADTHVEELFLERLRKSRPVTVEASADEAAQAQALLDEAEEELTAYCVNTRVSEAGAEAYQAGLGVRQQAAEQARQRLVEQQQTGGTDRQEVLDSWETLSVRERRLLLAAVVERVVARRGAKGASADEKLQVIWKETARLEVAA